MPIPKDLLLQASTELKDKTQIGFFVTGIVDDETKLNFGFGMKKIFNPQNTLKGKVDRDLNAAIYYEHKTGGALAIQGTIAKKFSDSSAMSGYLGTDYAIGLKLKYDN